MRISACPIVVEVVVMCVYGQQSSGGGVCARACVCKVKKVVVVVNVYGA